MDFFKELREDHDHAPVSRYMHVPAYLTNMLLSQGMHVVPDNWYSSHHPTEYLLKKHTNCKENSQQQKTTWKSLNKNLKSQMHYL